MRLYRQTLLSPQLSVYKSIAVKVHYKNLSFLLFCVMKPPMFHRLNAVFKTTFAIAMRCSQSLFGSMLILLPFN